MFINRWLGVIGAAILRARAPKPVYRNPTPPRRRKHSSWRSINPKLRTGKREIRRDRQSFADLSRRNRVAQDHQNWLYAIGLTAPQPKSRRAARRLFARMSAKHFGV